VSPRLLFVISDFEGGGAQRVAAALLERWVGLGWRVHLVTIAGADGDFFELPSGVTRSTIDTANGRRGVRAAVLNNLDRLRGIRREVRSFEPTAVVSFLDATNVLTLGATVGCEVPIVVSERSDPRFQPLALVWRVLRRVLYRRASAIVVQTESVAAWARRCFRRANVVVIPNPVQPLAPVAERSPDATRVVTVGRLSHEKGVDVLIAAFLAVVPAHPEWELVVVGDGPERELLESLARSSGYKDQIQFAGRRRDVGSLLATASLYVLASRHEGFPNALLEAMAAGLPCIAADCPSGPSEIICSGRTGVLVPPRSVRALAVALDALMSDADARAQLGRAAREEVLRRFALDSIGRRWDDLVGVSEP
jgi:glycosyltransferase involved in cell wall biosynthesis